MSVKYTSRTPQVQQKLSQSVAVFLRTLGDSALRMSEPITPKKRGNLRRDTLVEVKGNSGRVVWGKVYAAAQEKGVIKGRPIRKYTTPGTGKSYAETGIRRALAQSSSLLRKAGLL